MRAEKFRCFAGGLLAAMLLAASARADATFFVSPAGNDAWSGTLAEPNAAHTDGPFAAVARARDAARAQRSRHPDQPIDIRLRGGVYFLPEPLTLDPQDSGAAAGPTTWSAYANETPVLNGGRRLLGWEKTNVNGVDAWKLKLPAEASGQPFHFRELWINDHPAPQTRWPKAGTFAVAKEPKADAPKKGQVALTFGFNGQDVKAWPGAADGEVVMMTKWIDSRLPIASIDEKEHVLLFGKPAGFSPEVGDRYYIENVRETLSEPGEWQIDARENTVYLIPPAGVASPNDARVVAPNLAEVMRLNGDVTSNRWIEHVVFRGLTFSNSQWYYDHVAVGQQPEPDRTSYNQAAIGVPGAIVGDSVRDCIFDHCVIAHVGSYGITLGRACQGNRLTHCTLTDLAAGGLKIGETAVQDNPAFQSFGNEVSDCRITDGGKLFPSGVGLLIGQAHDNLISHNEIGRFWYTGISVGWTWGYGKALTRNNHIDHNEVHHIGMKQDGDPPILSDMGGIYTLGDEKGTVINNNVFHDVAGIHYGGWGIYFDEGTTDILAENNLVYRTTHGGFHQHYGKDNIVRNNIFAFGRDNQIQRTRLENHTSFRFEHNIVLFKTGEMLTGNWDKLNVVFDANTYWREGDKHFKFARWDWDQWRHEGMDVDSKIADPRFKNVDLADFHFKNGPPEGFKAFDWADVGPRKEGEPP